MWTMRPMTGWRCSAPLICLVLLGFSPRADAWWNDEWKYRKEIVVDLREVATDVDTTLSGVTVPIGLHSGNFPYFVMMSPGGEDLRVIAEDDQTPLPFHIESVDLVSGIARIWVKLAQVTPGTTRTSFWIYYGNDSATSAGDASASWDEDTLLAYHFAEAEGAPRDAAGYSRHALDSTATALVPGVVGSGLGFEASLSLELPAGVTSAAGEASGITLSFWLRSSSGGDGRLVTQPGAFTLHLENLTPVLELADGRKLVPERRLADDRWQHLAVTSGSEGIHLYLNGSEAASSPARLPIAQAPVVFGATAENAGDGFTGSIDELRMAAAERSRGWVSLARDIQMPGAEIVEFGQDESGAQRGTSRMLAMLQSLAANVNAVGWAVIAALGALALLAFDAMIGKQLLLRRISRADRRFIELVEGGAKPLAPENAEALGAAARDSGLLRLATAARLELAQLPAWSGNMPPAFLASVRSAMDAQLVEETNRLNEKMVWITLSVSGGPFLGLLGTVIGVMLTFAAIAESGDMNLNTIAPGVAAALMTTIAGLLVAIPALFGYNYLTGRITRQLASLEVFSDRLANSIAVMSSEQQEALREERHAA